MWKPSTSASVAITMRLYRRVSTVSSMPRAIIQVIEFFILVDCRLVPAENIFRLALERENRLVHHVARGHDRARGRLPSVRNIVSPRRAWRRPDGSCKSLRHGILISMRLAASLASFLTALSSLRKCSFCTILLPAPWRFPGSCAGNPPRRS